jgi:hypothetical protein
VHEVPNARPEDFPAPPSADEVASRFGRPVYTLVEQLGLIRLDGLSTVANGDRPVEVSVSYSRLVAPEDPTDPRNLVDDIDDVTGWIEKARREGRPAWFVRSLEARRFPMLWETVWTARKDADGAASLAESLVRHMDHVLINTVEGRRRRSSDHPGLDLDGPVNPAHARPTTIVVDGLPREGIGIDTDADIVGWAVPVDDLVVSIALDRDVAATLEIALEVGWSDVA